MKLIILGAPGSGKGTMAEQIQKDFGLPHISTGDILREEIEKNTKIGILAKSLIDNGNFVPDELIIKIVKNRIKQKDCKNGFVLDGFPRNLEQAKILSSIIKIDKAIYIDVPLIEIKNRLVRRRVCSKCKTIFNTDNYKKKTCSKCGAHLIKRADDAPEIIEKRFNIYLTQSAPLVEYYSKILLKIEGKGTPQENYAPIYKFLKKKVNDFGSEIKY